MVSIEHLDHFKEVLRSKIQNVRKDVDFAYLPFLDILGNGIVTSEGKNWMNQRRKISG
jgi:DNA phosphorothioation-dependent restriction protein DptG